MCAAGLRDPETKLFLKKTTEIWASDERLIPDLRTLQCNRTHQHILMEGDELIQDKSGYGSVPHVLHP
eukprot:10910805-Prorocentrum_lima.AAC.1